MAITAVPKPMAKPRYGTKLKSPAMIATTSASCRPAIHSAMP